MQAHPTTTRTGGLRTLCAMLVLACGMPHALGQLTFVPDVQLRTYLNTLVPGCVDGNGFLDPAFPGVQQITELAPPPTCEDYTGVDQLSGVQTMHAGPLGVMPDDNPLLVYPPGLQHLLLDNFTTGQGGGTTITIPPMPASLLSLRIMNWYGADTIQLPAMPPALEHLTVHCPGENYFPSFPVMPASLRSLNLLWVSTPEIPTLPTDVDTLSLWVYLDTPLEELPAGLEYLDWFMTDCLPPLPQGLETLYSWQACVPNFPSTLTMGLADGVPIANAPVCGPLDPCAAPIGTGVDAAVGTLPQLQLFPNPVSHQVVVVLPANTNNTVVDVLDATGRVVASVLATNARTVLDAAPLPAGVYHVRAAGQVSGLVKQ